MGPGGPGYVVIIQTSAQLPVLDAVISRQSMVLCQATSEAHAGRISLGTASPKLYPCGINELIGVMGQKISRVDPKGVARRELRLENQ